MTAKTKIRIATKIELYLSQAQKNLKVGITDRNGGSTVLSRI